MVKKENTAHPARKSRRRQDLFLLSATIVLLILLNLLAAVFFIRIDLTADKRYTLTDSTRKALRMLDDVVFVRVYLKGDFPSGFKRLASSTREMLDEFKVYGGAGIQYEFINPTEGKNEEELAALMKELAEKGLEPTNVQTRGGDEYSQQIVVPGALVTYKGREVAVNLLENNPGTGAQSALNNSIARLEFQFMKAIRSLSFSSAPRIGFITGHGEVTDFRVADWLSHLSLFYQCEYLSMDEVVSIPASFDALVILKPSRPFPDKDKFKIDQYVMNGGSVLWMVEPLNAEMDSLVTKRSFLTMDYPLQLEDQLFRYGVRINPDLLMDLQCNPVPLLVNMENRQPDFRLFPCPYFPVFTPGDEHPIVRNIDAVRSVFSSTIDTLKLNSVKKTVLLHSSSTSRSVFTPWLVDFSELGKRPETSLYNRKSLVTAVLLEGKFPSLFRNRVPPEMAAVLKDSLKTPFLEESKPARMIVLADGDLAVNEFNAQGQPLPLGFYKYTGEYFANKTFLDNCIDYLTGQQELIETRSKMVELRLLDEVKVKEAGWTWRLINLIIPLILLILLAIVINLVRSLKYAR